jgi:uncharacterized DUF497 family protein
LWQRLRKGHFGLEFEWDKANRGHIARHGVTPKEVEQVVLNDPLFLELQIRKNEERTIRVGETAAGRILVVITAWRGERLRPVTAFPANKRLRNLYAQYEGESQGGGTKNS